MRENKERKLLERCLVERGRGKNDGGAHLGSQKSFLPKRGRKLGGKFDG